MQDKCTWDPRYTSEMRKHFETKGSDRYKDIMHKERVRYAKDGKPPTFIITEFWDQLLHHWATPTYQVTSNQAKKNRASEKGGALHTAGRVCHSEIAMQAVCV